MKKKVNYFVRILVIVFSIFLAILVLISFFNGDSQFQLSTGVITVLSLITVLILSEAFDNLNLGKILSLSRDIKTKEKEVENVKRENNELRNNLINLSSTFSQLQSLSQSTTNNNVLFTPETIRMMLGVEKAEPDEVEEDQIPEENMEQSEDKDKNETSQHTEKQVMPRVTYKMMRELKQITLKKYTEKYNIDFLQIVQQVQFKNSFSNIDPIMEKRIIFNAYFKTDNLENFIEVKRKDFSPLVFDQIYVKLAKIMFYTQAKKINAYLTLLLIELPEVYENPQHKRFKSFERLYEIFQPAIANNLLKIEVIKITAEDISHQSSAEVAVSVE